MVKGTAGGERPASLTVWFLQQFDGNILLKTRFRSTGRIDKSTRLKSDPLIALKLNDPLVSWQIYKTNKNGKQE